MRNDLLIFSIGLWGLRDELAALTGLTPKFALTGSEDCAAIAGWGHKPTARRARRLAAQARKPYIAFEDGLLRSVRPGKGARPLSLVMDRTGIYYDARQTCDLENMLATEDFTPSELETAQAIIDTLKRERLSKYNDAPHELAERPFTANSRNRVLVLDQTYRDASIEGGLAGPQTFSDMVRAARSENPNAEIAVKLHPETLTGSKRGYLRNEAERLSLKIIDRAVNPWDLLADAPHVYTVSSQLGLEALMAGCKVTSLGLPFYAGWGLTDDRQSSPRRGRQRSLADLIAAAYLRYAHYFDPWTRKPVDPLTAIDQLKFLRDRFLANREPVVGFAVARWKQRPIAALLEGPRGRPSFARSFHEALRLAKDRHARLASWGRTANREAERARREGIPLVSIEDGFIRSAGLGAAFTPSLSFTFDNTGIYYDPSRVSDLEILLQSIALTPELRLRAQNLRKKIIDLGLTKYNVAAGSMPAVPTGRDIVLVPGQVVDDEAVRLGVPEEYLATNPLEGGANLALLRRARRTHSGAFIVYKPHPDVERLGRLGHIPREIALNYADVIATNSPMAALLAITHRVETLTSLSGFEAILRGIPVTVHGQPFYAGWGLTDDLDPPRRRTRRLDLDELVAGALILYPRYYDPVSQLPCPAEVAVERIAAHRLKPRNIGDELREVAGRLVIAARNLSRRSSG